MPGHARRRARPARNKGFSGLQAALVLQVVESMKYQMRAPNNPPEAPIEAVLARLPYTEDVVEADMAYYQAREARQSRVMEDVQEEQMVAIKYAGLSHQGKNCTVDLKNVATKYTPSGWR